MKSGVKKMMDAVVQGHCLIMSVAVNQEDAVAQQTKIEDDIEAVNRHHDEGEGEFSKLECRVKE